ncbi:MAG: SpoVA/SpoVAEb family sporulation membrane protein [Mycoplasmatota bacterium]
MEKDKYKQLVKKHNIKENALKNCIIAFVIGGLMGALAEFFIEFYSYILNITSSQANTLMIITFIFFGCLFTALGFFDNWVRVARSGLFIPITGFAHAMQSASLEYRKEGLITGIGSNMFKLAGSVIVYGVVSAYTFGLIRLIIFGG